MSDVDRDQRTEAPSEKRRANAREEGRVAQSHDFTFAVILLAALLTLLAMGTRIRDAFFESFDGVLRPISSGARDLGADSAAAALKTLLLETLACVLPLFVVLVPVSVAAAMLQIGFHPVPQKLAPKLERLAPNLSLGRFVNTKSLIETLTSLLKLAVLIAAAAFATGHRMQPLFASESPGIAFALVTSLGTRLLLSVTAALVLLGAFDLFLKRRDLEKDLRMTKEEAKQEAKDAQGDPEIRGRIRRRQREMGLRRMMDQVPKASAVVTNPTHFAIALKWQSGMTAPRVVAKGRDFVAQRIKEIAKQASVPIVENPPLARALFKACEVGSEIPPALYQAVAELLAAILRARRRLGRTA